MSYPIVASRRQQRTVCLFFLYLLASFGHLCAQAIPVPTFGSSAQPVGTATTPVSVLVTAKTAGTISHVFALTGGTASTAVLQGQGEALTALPNTSKPLDFSVTSAGNCTGALSAGASCSVSVTFTPQFPGVRLGAIVLLAADNTVLATAPLSGIGQGSLPVLVPGGIQLVAGDGDAVYAGDGGQATQAPIELPKGLAADAAGDLYFCDSGNNRVRKVDVNGTITTVAGNGTLGFSGDGGLAKNAQLNQPSGLALDGAGNLYVADTGNSAIRRVDLSGTITTVAGIPGSSGYSGDGAAAVAAKLSAPEGLGLTPVGNLVIADTGNSAIRLLDFSSAKISTIAGTGVAGYSGDGLATAVQLNLPRGVAVNVWGVAIADTENQLVRFVDLSGNLTTVVGHSAGARNYLGDQGPATGAELNEPVAVALDPAGDLFLADSENNVIRGVFGSTVMSGAGSAVAYAPGVIQTVAGTSGEGYSGDKSAPGGPQAATLATMSKPYALALDASGNLWISDTFNNRVREVNGSLLTINYPTMKVGTVSTTELGGQLYNAGNAALTLQEPTATIAPPTLNQVQLDASKTTCAQASVAPMGFCTMEMYFAPTQMGNPDGGFATWVSNAPNVTPVDALSGQVLTLEPTTTTLTASTTTPTIGQNVTLLANVTSSYGLTPTGTVTFSAGSGTSAMVLASAPLNASGMASVTLAATLSPGTRTVSATYSGDTYNAASSTLPGIQVQIQQVGTNTAVSADMNPLNAEATLHLTAIVSISAGDVAYGALTGTVSFTDGGNVLGTAAINSSGQATLAVNGLGVGAHSIVATFSGSTNYGSSISPALNEGVQQTSTQTILSTSSTTARAGRPVVLTATVVSSTGVPTGSIKFLDGSAVLGSATVNASGVATLTITTFSVGTHTLTAVYSGDPNYQASTSAAITQTETLAQPVLQLSGPTSALDAGTSAQFVVSLTTQGVTPTGTLTLLDGASAIGSSKISANGSFPFSTTQFSVGTHTIVASYGGDANNAAVKSTALTVVVKQASTTTSLVSSANPLTPGAALTITANVTTDSPSPQGSVTLYDGTLALATVPLAANGSALFQPANLSLGTHNLTAVYAGDTNHLPSTSAVLPELVMQGSAATLSSSVNPSVSGQSVTFTAQILGAAHSGSQAAPTGAVVFRDNGVQLGSAPVNMSGAAVFSTASLGVGTHTITITYAGDGNYAAAQAQLSQAVTQATTTVTLQSSANPGTYGQVVNLMATVTSNGGTPTGTVNFTLGSGTAVGSAQLNASGVAVLSSTTLAPGTYAVMANYAGDGKAEPSTSTPLTLTIKQTTALALGTNANPALTLSPVVLTATLTRPSAVAATGSVAISDGGTVLGTAVLDATGHASLTLPQMSAGVHTLTASYGGDGADLASSSSAYSETVQLSPTTTSLSISAGGSGNPEQITLTAVVTGVVSTAPTGSVVFTSGTVTLGSAPVAGAGTATLTITPSVAASQVVASYSGDGSYAPSQSVVGTSVVQVLHPFTLGLNASNVTLVTQQHTNLTVTLNATSGFTDTVSLGCIGLPYAATCTFTKTNLDLASNGTASTNLMLDTGNPLGAGGGATALNRTSGSVTWLCWLPAGVLLGLLRRKQTRRTRQQLGMLFGLVMALALSMTTMGCGGLSTSGTPPGTYTFKVVATGQNSGMTQAQTVTLVVTQ